MQIDWLKEPWMPGSAEAEDAVVADAERDSNAIAVPTIIAAGKATVIADRRYRVYRPHNSALSVLIIRRARKHDAGVYRCNLSGSSTRQKYLVLNVTGQPARLSVSQILLCHYALLLMRTVLLLFCNMSFVNT